MIDLFGRIPVKARQWVRHIVYLPANETWAYNSGGNIAMFGRIDGDITVFIHETAHSLDLLGAYPDNPLSNSTTWLAQYAKDSNVPDPYAQTNVFEDVAQNTVVATYDLNVPGGFRAVESNWSGVSHQFRLIEREQNKAGALLVRGGNLLDHGGVCERRLNNSQPVKVAGYSTGTARRRGQPPDVRLSNSVDVIEPVTFNTREACSGGF